MANDTAASVPVYLPMATVHSAIQSLRAHGLPPKLDRSAFGHRSGGEQAGLIAGFKFLGLIDDAGNTQPILRRLKDAAAGSPEEKAIWDQLLRSRYGKVFQIDLASATPNQVAEALSSYGNPTGSTKKRVIRFFLKTAQYAGVDVSARLVKDLRDRGGDTSGQNAGQQDTTVNGGPKAKRKRRTQQGQDRNTADPPPAGGAMKTITLVVAGGTLTLNGTFNPFALVGDERELVYSIIDKMNAYESKANSES